MVCLGGSIGVIRHMPLPNRIRGIPALKPGIPRILMWQVAVRGSIFLMPHLFKTIFAGDANR